MEQMTVQATDSAPRPAPWLDLVLYLTGGIGLYVLTSVGLAATMPDNSLLRSGLLYLLNIACLGGSVLVIGTLRKSLNWAEMGFFPPRMRWLWFAASAALALLFIPLRAGIGLVVELLMKGSLDDLMGGRGQIFAPEGFSWLALLVSLVLTGIAVPISEELFFRGAIYTWIRSRLSPWPAILISSMLFGMAHFDSPGVAVASFLLGIVNAAAFHWTRSLWVPITIHALNNSVAILLVYALLAVQRAVGMTV
jgi:uncharacterized protein